MGRIKNLYWRICPLRHDERSHVDRDMQSESLQGAYSRITYVLTGQRRFQRFFDYFGKRFAWHEYISFGADKHAETQFSRHPQHSCILDMTFKGEYLATWLAESASDEYTCSYNFTMFIPIAGSHIQQGIVSANVYVSFRSPKDAALFKLRFG